MDTTEVFVKERLRSATAKDVVFLKKHWNEWIARKDWQAFERKTGANPQVVYGILDESRIKSVNLVKLSFFVSPRYEIRLRHSARYDLLVVIVIDQPSRGNIGVVTYYKVLTSHQRWFILW